MDTPDRILAAALRLFAERGYEAVGVQEVADAAEAAKPQLLHHFGGKQGLLEALMERHGRAWLGALEDAATYHGDLERTLLHVAKAFFAFAGRQPSFHRMMIAMWCTAPASAPHQVVAPYVLRQHQILEGIFREAERDRALRGQPSAQALALSGALNSYSMSMQSIGEPLTDAMASEVVRQFVYGISSA
jgi:TetR/AcrR family transcriptional regulator